MIIAVSTLVFLGLFFGLGRIAIIQGERRDTEKVKAKAEKERGDRLQHDLDILNARTEENQRFFEIVRQLSLAQTAAERQALLDQLKAIQFGSVTTTTTSPRSDPREFPSSTTTTTTTPNSSPTTAPRAPPSTTTTTQPSPPPSIVCLEVPATHTTICK